MHKGGRRGRRTRFGFYREKPIFIDTELYSDAHFIDADAILNKK